MPILQPMPQMDRDVFAPRRPSTVSLLQAKIVELDEATAEIDAAKAAAATAQDTADTALARAPGTTAWSFPKYLVANLPWAADFPEAFVKVRDNPQGLASSVNVSGDVWHWISEVDGSDLGPGNAPSP